jgi:hypothetical protein
MSQLLRDIAFGFRLLVSKPGFAAVAILTLALGIALSALSSFARTQDKPKPSGPISPREILEQNATAIGLTAAAAVQTLEVSGEFVAQDGRPLGDFRFFYESPGSYLAELNFVNHGQAVAGRRGDGQGIFRLSGNGLPVVNGVTIFAVAAAWQRLVQPEDEYKAIDLVSLATIDNSWAYAIRLVSKRGDLQIGYYDSDTFLLKRMELEQRVRNKKNGSDKVYRVWAAYNDYQTSESLNVPRELEVFEGSNEIDFHVQSVRVNLPIDDAKFAAGR